MRAHSRAVVTAGGVLQQLSSQPPLTLRRVRDADRETCALCLVGTAAGPLDGDELALEIEVSERARARLVASGASLATGRTGTRARFDVDVTVATAAELIGQPGPLIAARGCTLDVRLQIRLAADASLTWTELVALGRSGEQPGALRSAWDVERDGRPLLRQTTDLRDPRLRDWPGMIAGARFLATELRAGPGVAARTGARSRTSAVHALAADAELITVLASDAVSAIRELAALRPRGYSVA